MTEPIQTPAATPSGTEVRDLAAALAAPAAGGVTLTKGVVTAFNLAGTPPDMAITLNGDSTPVNYVRFIDSYSPTVGDTVLILKQGSDIVALGQIAATPGSNNGWQTPTLDSGWGLTLIQYRIVVDHGERLVQFRGWAQPSASPSTIFTLPSGYRPSALRVLSAARDTVGDASVTLYVNTSGVIQLFVSTAGGNAVTGGTNTAPSHNHTNPEGGFTGNGGSHFHNVNSHYHPINFPAFVSLDGLSFYI